MGWKEKYERIKTRQTNADERAHEMLMMGGDTLAVFGGLGVMGYIHGRKAGIPEVGRMPMDALLGGAFGLVGWGLSWAGYGFGRTVASLGTGFGGYWFSQMMAKYGQDKREAAGEKLNRAYTSQEALDKGVQWRPPILAGGAEVPQPQAQQAQPQPQRRLY